MSTLIIFPLRLRTRCWFVCTRNYMPQHISPWTFDIETGAAVGRSWCPVSKRIFIPGTDEIIKGFYCLGKLEGGKITMKTKIKENNEQDTETL